MSLEQVARRAKVSTATVSRVLNNASFVKNTTRTRVMKAVEELKYHPNLHARSLAGGKSRSIGVIVSNIEYPADDRPASRRSGGDRFRDGSEVNRRIEREPDPGGVL